MYVRAYRNTFTLRRAPYLLTYALFSAAAIFLLDARGHRVAIQFCYEALNEVVMPNYGFRRPVKIMRNLINQLELQSDSSVDAYLNQNQMSVGQPLWSNERASTAANDAIRETLNNTQAFFNFETALRRESADRTNDILGSELMFNPENVDTLDNVLLYGLFSTTDHNIPNDFAYHNL